MVGCVSLSWMATWEGKSFQALLVFLKRRTMSYRDAAHQKYCCFKRSSLPRSRLPKLLATYESGIGAHVLVIGVQDGRDGLSPLLVSNRAFILSRVEFLEVEFTRSCLAAPQPKVVGGRCAVPGNYSSRKQSGCTFTGSVPTRDVIGHSLHNFPALPDRFLLTAFVAAPLVSCHQRSPCIGDLTCICGHGRRTGCRP